MKGDTLIIRADASIQMGTGHVMRCLALAQAWQVMDGHAILVTASLPDGLVGRLKTENVQIEPITAVAGSETDANATISLARKFDASAIVIDGYQFDSAYQAAVKAADFRTLFVDDYGHCDAYVSDWVLNQNVYASDALYSHRSEDVELLLGTQYALLRREFWAWREWERPQPTNPIKLLVTLGGADPDNVTQTVIEAIKQISEPQLEVVVLVGGSNPHYEQLCSYADDRITLRKNVTDMPQLMAWADVAISAGGSTCWELAFMGLPNLIVILADNQWPIATTLHDRGVAVNVGWGNEVSADTIASHLSALLSDREGWQAMSGGGRQLVDSLGAKRIAQRLNYPLRIRPVNHDDVKLIFEWANDSITRQMSFHSEPIAWETHVSWFEHTLSSGTQFSIVECCTSGQWKPVGQTRINGNNVISMAIAPDFRGYGLGQAVLETALKDVSDQALIAYIKPENVGSKKIFERAGFQLMGENATVAGQSCCQYMYAKRRDATHV